MSLIRLEEVGVRFGARLALDAVSLRVEEGERVALVGESGSGKSTLARVALGLVAASEGAAWLDGRDAAGRPARRALPRVAQLLHQDPRAHLGVGLSVRALLRESARAHRPEEDADALGAAALAAVGLAGLTAADPHTLSGGEQRRLGVARVLLARPRLLVADEPTTGLDPVLAGAVAGALGAHGGALLLVTHDLGLARRLCTRVVVMLGGRCVEDCPTASLDDDAHHPHLRALLAAARGGASAWSPDRAPGPGCTLRASCPTAVESCARPVPLRDIGSGRRVACPAVEAPS